MIYRSARLGLVAALLLSASHEAFAQYQYQNPEGSASESAESGESVAQLQVKITALQEQLSSMQGNVERVSFENKQLKAELEKSRADTELRIGELEKKQQQVVAAAPVAPPPAPAVPAPMNSEPDMAQMHSSDSIPGETEELSNESPSSRGFANAHEQYNYAYTLMSQAKYAEAGNTFADFTKKHPKDPLIGNAFYWLGETFYVRHDYVKAADNFRQGYESMPTGAKAPDNLFKLAMSLNALGKEKESCVVLKQVVNKFSGATSTKARAEQEINRVGCS